MPRDAALPALLTLVGLFCAVKALLSYISDPRSLGAILLAPGVVLGGVALLVAWGLWGPVESRLTFHGHGDTRARAMAHEKRHKRVLDGLGIMVDKIRVWEERHGWAGQTTINKSAANMRRWNALIPAEQAAVYMAGAMGPGGIPAEHCSDDLAAVDARTSRPQAAAIARKYL